MLVCVLVLVLALVVAEVMVVVVAVVVAVVLLLVMLVVVVVVRDDTSEGLASFTKTLQDNSQHCSQAEQGVLSQGKDA